MEFWAIIVKLLYQILYYVQKYLDILQQLPLHIGQCHPGQVRGATEVIGGHVCGCLLRSMGAFFEYGHTICSGIM